MNKHMHLKMLGERKQGHPSLDTHYTVYKLKLVLFSRKKHKVAQIGIYLIILVKKKCGLD